MYVCSCRAVTDLQVSAAVTAGARSVSELTLSCGAGGGCGGCHELLARLLASSELDLTEDAGKVQAA